MKKLLLLSVLLSTSALAAPNSPSGSPRVQGVPAGYGDPVQVTIRNADGSTPTGATLPTDASTATNQDSERVLEGALTETAPATDTASSGLNGRLQRVAQRLTTINTTLGTPFQVGGSIGNTSFAATQSGTWNITNVSGTVSLPTGASTSANQSTQITNIGTPGDTACATDNGSCGLNALIQRGNQRLTIINTTLGSPFQAGASIGNTTFAATQATASSLNAQVVGSIASGSADSGNPIKVGGVLNTTLPTFTNGQRGDFQIGTRGAQNVTLFDLNSTSALDAITVGSDVLAPARPSLSAASLGLVWTGSVWARSRGDTNGNYVGGNVASGATDAGNPVKIGGRYNSTLPTLTNGQRGDAQLDSRGNLRATTSLVSTAGVDAFSNNNVGWPVDNTADAAAGGVRIGATAPFVYNGTTWDRARGDTNGTVTQPFAMSGSRWNYAAAAGGITNTTTAVTIAAAAGASVRNYLTSIQITCNTLGAAGEFAVRDGAAGTVLWRTYLTTTAQEHAITFPAPLRGTANTLMEVVTLTASITGACYVNAQGFTGA